MNSELKKSFLSVVRLGIGHGHTEFPNEVDWPAIKALAEKQGLSAIVLDGIEQLPLANRPPQKELLTWIGETLQEYEYRYELYCRAIAEMAAWHRENGFKMMVLKGYSCAMNWPRPEHRPCGDIDIWQFGRQKEADDLLESVEMRDECLESVHKSKRIKVDKSHHHHTVFRWRDFTVENHYDFLNVHHHKSNVEMETILKELGQDDSHFVELHGEKVYVPSPNLHALFLLRHSMSNFASTGMRLRQLLDWAFLVEKHGKEIDWKWLEDIIEQFGMRKLYDIFNAVCVGDLGFDASLFPMVRFSSNLKERVLNDILSPEFSETEKGGFIRRAFFKYRRWSANAWKHELCFNESLWSAFWSGVKSHLLKPSSI